MGLESAYKRTGKKRTVIKSKIPKDIGTRMKILQTWNNDFDARVERQKQLLGKGGTFTNPLVIKQADNKIKQLQKMLQAKNKVEVEKVKAQGVATKEAIKEKMANARAAYNKTMAAYNKNPDKFTRMPNFSDFENAAKNKLDYPTYQKGGK
jgi:hypothetical protein